jgi:prepilin-type processing-associated H-X9-DG protein
MLGALLAPAVQMVRESARRMQCGQQLRQITIAGASYHDAYDVFPPIVYESSILWRLLPFIEPNATRSSLHPAPYAPPYLRCPSDFDGWGGRGSNYGVNFGSGLDVVFDGAFSGGQSNIGAAAIADGTSNTAFASEWVRAKSDAVPIDRRDLRPIIFNLSNPGVISPATLADKTDECLAIDPSVAPVFSYTRGLEWSNGLSQSDTGYTHALTPGLRSCSVGGTVLAWTVGSQHTGGVNVAFADGSVRFIANSIARDVWRAMGTRRGNEVRSD